jgi:hypothetical protein
MVRECIGGSGSEYGKVISAGHLRNLFQKIKSKTMKANPISILLCTVIVIGSINFLKAQILYDDLQDVAEYVLDGRKWNKTDVFAKW